MYRVIRPPEELPLGMPMPAVELFTVTDRDREVTEMARHKLTPQLLAATDGKRWGMWLAPAGDVPRHPVWIELDHDEALLLEAGTWHHGPIPLEGEHGTYLTVEAPNTNRDDFERQAVER